MSLGETIYRLRTEKNMSQGDLAEKLDVSRQSISKWENNSAVPDLEKIIKLSEIFAVSLDELIKGEEAPHRTEKVTPLPEEKHNENGFPPRKIAGTILLCMAFLVTLFLLVAGGGFAGFIFALPFLICGILCFILKKDVGLWCAWAVYVLFDLYMPYGTGISRASVLYTFQWTYEMNYVRLVFAWIMVLILAAIIAVTVVRFGNKPLASEKNGCNYLIVAWLVLIVLQVIAMIWGHSETYKYIIENITTTGAIYRVISVVLSWARIILLTVALIFTARYVKTIKER